MAKIRKSVLLTGIDEKTNESDAIPSPECTNTFERSRNVDPSIRLYKKIVHQIISISENKGEDEESATKRKKSKKNMLSMFKLLHSIMCS